MKKYIPLLLCAISFHTMALGGFESLTETQQNVTKSIVNQLGVDDPDNTIKGVRCQGQSHVWVHHPVCHHGVGCRR